LDALRQLWDSLRVVKNVELFEITAVTVSGVGPNTYSVYKKVGDVNKLQPVPYATTLLQSVVICEMNWTSTSIFENNVPNESYTQALHVLVLIISTAVFQCCHHGLENPVHITYIT
jgi:hypothetical protein